MSRLVLEVPPVPVDIGRTQVLVMDGVNATASPRLTVEGCTFDFGPADKTLLAGGAVLATSDCSDLALRGNRFACAGNVAMTRLLFGLLVTAGSSTAALDDCEISGNLFTGLGLPVGVLGAIGLVRCQDNRVRQCAGGFYFITSSGALAGRLATHAAPPDDESGIREAARLPVSPSTLAATAEALLQAIVAAGTRAAGGAPALDSPAAGAAAPLTGAAAAASVDAILDALDQETEAAELGGAPPRPALHLRDNDIELSATSRPSGNQVFVGLYVAMVGPDRPCAALVHGNRIETPATDVTAATIAMYRAQAVVTANLFTQLPGQVANPVPCLNTAIFVGGFEVMGNVISPQATIAPARLAPPTNDWPFLNTIG